MDNDAVAGIISTMDRSNPPHPRVDELRDQVVLLRGVSWAQYEGLLQGRGEAPQPRMAYLDGDLEVMTTGFRHEIGKKLIARLVETYAEERALALNGAGNMTFQKRAKQAGLEPDECYWLGKIRPAPDLALEIVETSGGVDKLEIYRRLGAREVWFWIEARLWIYVLAGRRYREVRQSVLLPELDVEELARIVVTTEDDAQTEAVRAYRRRLQRAAP